MKASILGLFLLSLVACCHATSSELGISFNKQSGQLPTLTLPYGTWRARNFTNDVSVYDRDRERIHSLTIT